jgi:rhodanese-related sulfurtransferase
MRTHLALLAAITVTSCQQSAPAAAAAPPAPAAQARRPRAVMGAEARALVGAGAVLVDVRTVDEFAELHVEGARNIPLSELGGALGTLPKDKPIIVYCAVGSRSAVAANMLASAGHDALNLGAMENWNR